MVNPLILHLAKTTPEIAAAQHFEISADVTNFAIGLADELISDPSFDPDEPIKAPETARPPGNAVTISLEGYHGLFVITDDANGEVWLHATNLEQLAVWRPGHSVRAVATSLAEAQRSSNAAVCVAFILSLINTPSLTRLTPAGTRQQRRAAQRGMGFAPDAWTRVSWDISAETVARISRDPDFHKVPLHWRRGHYRRALPHYKGAVQLPDAILPEHRTGWWQWIEAQWVGHPAFGVKRSIHAPRLSQQTIDKARGRQINGALAHQQIGPAQCAS